MDKKLSKFIDDTCSFFGQAYIGYSEYPNVRAHVWVDRCEEPALRIACVVHGWSYTFVEAAGVYDITPIGT